MSQELTRDILRDEKDSHLSLTIYEDDHSMICLSMHKPHATSIFLHLTLEETKKLYDVLWDHFGIPDEYTRDPTEP